MKKLFRTLLAVIGIALFTTSCTVDDLPQQSIVTTTYKYEVKFMVTGYRGYYPTLTTQSTFGTTVYDYQSNNPLIATGSIELAGGNYYLKLSDIPRWTPAQVDIIEVVNDNGSITETVLHTAQITIDETTMDSWHINYDLSTDIFTTALYE